MHSTETKKGRRRLHLHLDRHAIDYIPRNRGLSRPLYDVLLALIFGSIGIAFVMLLGGCSAEEGRPVPTTPTPSPVHEAPGSGEGAGSASGGTLGALGSVDIVAMQTEQDVTGSPSSPVDECVVTIRVPALQDGFLPAQTRNIHCHLNYAASGNGRVRIIFPTGVPAEPKSGGKSLLPDGFALRNAHGINEFSQVCHSGTGASVIEANYVAPDDDKVNAPLRADASFGQLVCRANDAIWSGLDVNLKVSVHGDDDTSTAYARWAPGTWTNPGWTWAGVIKALKGDSRTDVWRIPNAQGIALSSVTQPSGKAVRPGEWDVIQGGPGRMGLVIHNWWLFPDGAPMPPGENMWISYKEGSRAERRYAAGDFEIEWGKEVEGGTEIEWGSNLLEDAETKTMAEVRQFFSRRCGFATTEQTDRAFRLLPQNLAISRNKVRLVWGPNYAYSGQPVTCRHYNAGAPTP